MTALTHPQKVHVHVSPIQSGIAILEMAGRARFELTNRGFAARAGFTHYQNRPVKLAGATGFEPVSLRFTSVVV